MSTSSEGICIECHHETSSSDISDLRTEYSGSGEDGRRRRNGDASLQRRQARLAHQQRQAVERQQQQRSAHRAVGVVDPGGCVGGVNSAAGGRVQAADGDPLATSEEAPLDSAAALADVPPLWQNLGLLTGAGPRAESHLSIAAETLAATDTRLDPVASLVDNVSPSPAALCDDQAPERKECGLSCRRESLQQLPSTVLGTDLYTRLIVDREAVGWSQDKSHCSCDCGCDEGGSRGSGCRIHNGEGSGCCGSSNVNRTCGTSSRTAPISVLDTTHSESKAARYPHVFATDCSRASVRATTEAASLNMLVLDVSRLDVSVASQGATDSASTRSLSRTRLSEADEAVTAALQRAYCNTIDASSYAKSVAITDVIDRAVIANCIAMFVRRLVGFARYVDEFATLPLDVQLAALSQAALPCLVLCSSQAYNPAGDCWDCGSGGRPHQTHLPLTALGPALPSAVIDEHRMLASAIRRLLPRDAAAGDCDAFVFALLHAIVLLSPECTTAAAAEVTEADHVAVATRLADAQHRYIMLLGRLLQARLSFAHAASLLPMLLRCVDSCKRATANVAAALGAWDRLLVDSLMFEVLPPFQAEPQAADVE